MDSCRSVKNLNSSGDQLRLLKDQVPGELSEIGGQIAAM